MGSRPSAVSTVACRFFTWQHSTTAADATPIDLTLPADPVLAGATLGVQVLVRSDAAPAALAWSEVVGITLE